MAVWEIMQRPNSGIKTLVIVQESEYPDQGGFWRQGLDQRKSTTRRLRVRTVGSSRWQECQGVIVNAVKAVEMTRVRQVSTVVDNHADRLSPLGLAQPLGN